MLSAQRIAGRSASDIRMVIEAFLKNSKEPALFEPGESLLPLTSENFPLEIRGSRLTLQAWDRTRNLSRRVTAIKESTDARLELIVERFARREGPLFLLDLARRAGAELGKRSGRLVFRERFRLFLRRQFPGVEPRRVECRSRTSNLVFRRHFRAPFSATASTPGPPSPVPPKAMPPPYSRSA